MALAAQPARLQHCPGLALPAVVAAPPPVPTVGKTGGWHLGDFHPPWYDAQETLYQPACGSGPEESKVPSWPMWGESHRAGQRLPVGESAGAGADSPLACQALPAV